MANKVPATTSNNASNGSFSHYPEIDDIRHDLDSLKTNVVELTKHIKEDGKDEVAALAKMAKKRVTKIQSAGKREIQKLEGEIKTHPMQSVAAALAAGFVLSFFFRK